MKLIADAAIIGFPNAGKSSLISKVSAAKPKIADYPFTTLEPHLGVVAIDDREFVLADIPGLIEGAADGKGLGHEFLRHVERARALVVLLDPSPMQSLSAADQLEVLLNELTEYSPDLTARPRLVAINKADLPEAAEAAAELSETVLISAMTGEGLKEFLHRVANLVDLADRAAPERPGFILHRPSVPRFSIRREGTTWVVEGAAALRAVGFADLTLPEAADRSARNLARLGVDRQLAEAGAQSGDEVRIGDITFEFEPPAHE
jgi:GTP-binding protein